MSNDYLKDIKGIIESLQVLNKQVIIRIIIELDRIIAIRITDINVVSNLFDRMLSLKFIGVMI